jgi:hypothetical protein
MQQIYHLIQIQFGYFQNNGSGSGYHVELVNHHERIPLDSFCLFEQLVYALIAHLKRFARPRYKDTIHCRNRQDRGHENEMLTLTKQLTKGLFLGDSDAYKASAYNRYVHVMERVRVILKDILQSYNSLQFYQENIDFAYVDAITKNYTKVQFHAELHSLANIAAANFVYFANTPLMLHYMDLLCTFYATYHAIYMD